MYIYTYISIGLTQVKEEGWTGFSKGWQGCSKFFKYLYLKSIIVDKLQEYVYCITRVYIVHCECGEGLWLQW